MEWVQAYNPLGQPMLSSLAAGLPIVVLLGMLVVGYSAPRAAMSGLAVALAIAIGLFKMPFSAAMASAGYGACFGLLPIGWIVLAAVFLFQLTSFQCSARHALKMKGHDGRRFSRKMNQPLTLQTSWFLSGIGRMGRYNAGSLNPAFCFTENPPCVSPL